MRGISLNKQTRKWRASIGGGARYQYLGEYSTQAEAERVRRAAEIERSGREYADPSPHVIGLVALVPLLSQCGVVRAWACVDVEDLDLISGSSWCLSRSGYAVARIGGTIVYMHRLIVPGRRTRGDHADRNRLNNCLFNLRLATNEQNARNRRVLAKNNTSGFKGVSRTSDGRSWRARITVGYCENLIGRFPTPEQAATAYDEACRKLHGEFASLNSDRPALVITVEPAAAAGSLFAQAAE